RQRQQFPAAYRLIFSHCTPFRQVLHALWPAFLPMAVMLAARPDCSHSGLNTQFICQDVS
ncbi:MAG: hypothetical protein KDJ78_06430, partial [Rhodobacteraceae bacterium]|nr:hypothetical protein [Paracoccaceae bacterium]